jgi:hypothetical protein
MWKEQLSYNWEFCKMRRMFNFVETFGSGALRKAPGR